MDEKSPVVVFWFRRDLRLDDNAGLYHALKSGQPVLPLFIFDAEILAQLQDKDDARVTFIYETMELLDKELQSHGSSLLVLHDTPANAWEKLVNDFAVTAVYTNHDYEPYAKSRDEEIGKQLQKQGITFKTYKDQVIFEKDEVVKDDGKPYTVYTPYQRKWYQAIKPFYLKSFPNKKYFSSFLKTKPFKLPTLKQIGFEKSSSSFPAIHYQQYIAGYADKRDYPAVNGTTHIGLHLRFGTVSIRDWHERQVAMPKKHG